VTKRTQLPDPAEMQRYLAELKDVKRRILETGGWDSESTAAAREVLRGACTFIRTVREDLESNLLADTLGDMTPEQARAAIKASKAMEAELSPPLDS
jgi:hypothetical protein